MCLACGPDHQHVSSAAASLALGRRGLLLGLGSAALAACVGSGETGLGVNLVSNEQVTQMGLESWAQLRAERPASNNPTYQQALRNVGGRILAANGENPGAWEMVVFQGSEANAFVLPGNKMGVYEGMFAVAQNEAQLAAVIGHELAHQQAGHAAERVSTAAASNLGVNLAGAVLEAGNVGYAREMAALLGLGVEYGVVLPYGRNQELQADAIGLENMARAGYDPREAINLWTNMARASGSRGPAWMSTHPAPGDRIAQLQSLMPQALAVYQAQGGVV